MTEQAERAAVACPSCSPSLETVHEVLTTGGGKATVKCTECGHVHKEQLDTESEVERRVVVSQDGESFRTTVTAPPDEEVAVGEEFVVEAEEGIFQVRITSLEVAPGQRRHSGVVDHVDTFWTRAVDNVTVDVTLHPEDGGHDETRSVELHVPGDYEFTVGATEAFGDEEFEITGIAVRKDAEHYDRDKFDHDGDTVEAKDVQRVYGYDQTTDAWSAW